MFPFDDVIMYLERLSLPEMWDGLLLNMTGCTASIFDRIPLAKENLFENISSAKDQPVIISPFLHDSNSLATGGFDYSLKLVNFTLTSMINIWSIFCEIAIRWMPQYLTDH